MIPTFQRPAQLAEALESVLSQTGVSVAVIVVDDDPDQSAAAVVRAFADPRIRYMAMEVPSRGRPALVRNTALPHVTAPLVHFLDDDDKVPAGHYARVRHAFAAHPAVGVMFGRIDPFGEAAESVMRHERDFFARAARRARACRRFGPKWGFAATMLFRNTLLVCGAGLIRRECVAALAGFDTTLTIIEDVDFYARAIRRFGAGFLDETALHYRIGPSLMHRPDIQPLVDAAYRDMFARYRREWGTWNFFLLKIFARLFCR